MQIKYTKKTGKCSSLLEIYNDENLCSQIDCNLIKNLQLVVKPKVLLDNYDEYVFKYKNILTKYLVGNTTAEDTLREIDNIEIIYNIDYKSKAGIIVIVLTVTFMMIVFASYRLMFIKKFNFYLTMINKYYWFVFILGVCVCLSINLFMLGKVTIFKCNTILIATIIGISLIFYPFYINGIINFPEENKISEYVRKHQFSTLCILLLIDIFFILVFSILPSYHVETNYIENGMNFNICLIKDKITYMFLTLVILLKLLLFISVIFLVFMEWNSDFIFNDVKIVSFIIYSVLPYILSVIILNVVNLKNYYLIMSAKIGLNTLLVIIIYFITFWWRMYLELNNSDKKNDRIKYFNDENGKENINISNNADEIKTLKTIQIEDHHIPETSHRMSNYRRSKMSTPSSKFPKMSEIKEEISEENISE